MVVFQVVLKHLGIIKARRCNDLRDEQDPELIKQLNNYLNIYY